MDTTMEFDNNSDIIDSRDVIARIAELTADVDRLAELDALHELAPLTADEIEELWSLYCDVTDNADELQTLTALADEARDCAPDWEHGETLIRKSYFVEYAQQLAEDCGMISATATWPNNHIDWDAAADELEMDYTEVAFDDVVYFIR